MCANIGCGKPGVIQVETNDGEPWLCETCYGEYRLAGKVIQILDDIYSRTERIMQDKMMGGR